MALDEDGEGYLDHVVDALCGVDGRDPALALPHLHGDLLHAQAGTVCHDDGLWLWVVEGVALAEDLEGLAVARAEAGGGVRDVEAGHVADAALQPAYARPPETRGLEAVRLLHKARADDEVGPGLDALQQARHIAYVMLAVAVHLNVNVVAMGKRVQVLREVFDRASQQADRYGRNEIKYVTTIDVPALRKQIDKYSQQLRKLDIEIQALNFITEME